MRSKKLQKFKSIVSLVNLYLLCTNYILSLTRRRSGLRQLAPQAETEISCSKTVSFLAKAEEVHVKL